MVKGYKIPLDETRSGYYTEIEAMKKQLRKKTQNSKSEEPLELERDWQDLQLQYDEMNVDWNQLAAQVDVLKDSDSFLSR